MGVSTTSRVWELSQSEGTDRLVMLALADWCDDNNECYPGITRIAEKCRISERTVQRSIAKLREDGELETFQGRGVKTETGPTNRYRLIFTKKDEGGRIQTNTDARGDKLSCGDKQGTKGVTNGVPRDVTGDTQTIREPSGEPSEEEPTLSLEVEKPKKLSQEQLITRHLLEPYLNDSVFLGALSGYCAMRKAKKAPITEQAGEIIARKLIAWGKAGATDSLETSTTSNWTGVFPPKNAPRPNPSGIAPVAGKPPQERTFRTRAEADQITPAASLRIRP